MIAYLKQFQVPLLGISLHRHQQAFDTIKTIQEVKKALPDLKIVLGGKTATFFAQEILEEYPEIDFVITGDGEFPLLQLSNYLSNEIEDISIIPNLVYRDERNAIIKNFAHFEITPENYQEFSFSDISLVKNSEKYLKIRQDSLSEKRENVYFSCGRGCSGNCVFCAGSRVSEQKYAIRTAPFFYDIPYVINELKKLIES
ncbi:MAG: cobalamin-dependent protein [Candidatus Peribacteria bacterium]|nr:cobalamin-dependent protein [Candidatus Peribacteria bacterium]